MTVRSDANDYNEISRRHMNKEGKKSDISELSRIWPYLKPYKISIILVLIALFIASSAVLGISKSMQHVIDNGLAIGQQNALDKALLSFFLIILLLAISTALRYYLVTLLGENVTSNIRADIYSKILRMQASYYDKTRIGDIVSRLTNDVAEIQNIVGSSVSIALRNVIILLGALVMMIMTNPKLFCILIAVLPVVVFPIIFVGRIVRAYSRSVQNELALINAKAEETLLGIKVVQAYCYEHILKQDFEVTLKNMLDIARKKMFFRALIAFLVISLVFGDVIFVMWIGGHDMIQGELTSGQLMSFIFLGIIAAGSMGALAEVSSELQKAAGAAERINEFLSLDTGTVNGDQILDSSKDYTISFKEVRFYYESRPDNLVLRDLSFDIEPGKVTAIVGHSGAGKSTILQLMLRLYDFDSGSITFDNEDIRNFDIKSLREYFAYIPQEPVMFSNSLRENMKYGKNNASDSEIYEALHNASAMEFVSGFSDGLDTYIGERGVQLSGGQKQRIALARAFLKDSKILLLDEATSSLDSVNEKAIQSAIQNIAKSKTVVIVAHRLSTVLKADKILVLNDGVIAESGTHNELLSKNGVYAKLFSQLASQ